MRTAGAPEWVTEELVADTLATWQAFYPHKLTELDALEILLTVGRLFDALGDAHDNQTQLPGSSPCQ
jgi:hypothetical protein